MKFILIAFLSPFACSEDAEKSQTPKSQSTLTEPPLQSQSKQSEEPISDGGEPHISGTPSHISGQ